MATQIGSYDFRAANQARQSIEVGGRNLIRLPHSSDEWQEVSGTSTGYYLQFWEPYELEVGVTYTFSGIIEKVSDDSVAVNVTCGNGNKTYGHDLIGWQIVPTYGVKFAITYTVKDGDLSAGSNFAWRIRNEKQATTVRYKNIMLEKGTVASDWKPAEEDTEANILASGVEYIVGTQAAATNLWTGVTKEAALVAGKTIAYKLPYAGNSSAATLNLTLSGGGTTGAKGVRWNSNNAPNNTVTTHFGAGSVINMTYDGEYWRVAAQYHTDTTWQTRNNGAVKAETAITGGRIIVGTDAGYKNLAAGATFDLAHPPLYAGSNISAGGTGTNNFLQINITATNNGTITSGAAYKTLYLVGTISGSMFTVAASPFMTTVPPITEDNKVYMPLGVMTTATAVYFDSPKLLYAFIDGKFRQVTPTEIVATHRIYYRTATANVNLAAPQTWVAEANGNVYDAWTTKVPPLRAKNGVASTEEDATKYLYLYTCEQRKRLDGTTECTKVLLDENTTIIDGGQIVTNSIAANKLTVYDAAIGKIKSEYINVGAIDVKSTANYSDVESQFVDVNDSINGLQDEIDATNATYSHLIREVDGKVETALIDDQTGQYVGYRTVQSANGTDIYEPTSSHSVAHYGTSTRIGKESGLHLELSDTSLSFQVGTSTDKRTAYIEVDPDTLESVFYILHSVVVKDLRFGKWQWWNRPNNNMTLKWMGDD